MARVEQFDWPQVEHFEWPSGIALLKQNQQMLAVQAIPGVGPLTATALVASVGDVLPFKSGRHFASWLGLTPRQVGTGGKTQQLGISKRGDTYLRTMLIAGARSIVSRSAHNGWIERLLQRRHFNVVVAAVANKMADRKFNRVRPSMARVLGDLTPLKSAA